MHTLMNKSPPPTSAADAAEGRRHCRARAVVKLIGHSSPRGGLAKAPRRVAKSSWRRTSDPIFSPPRRIRASSRDPFVGLTIYGQSMACSSNKDPVSEDLIALEDWIHPWEPRRTSPRDDADAACTLANNKAAVQASPPSSKSSSPALLTPRRFRRRALEPRAATWAAPCSRGTSGRNFIRCIKPNVRGTSVARVRARSTW